MLGISITEASKILGVSQSTVKTVVQRSDRGR
jgi:transposase